MSVFLLSTYTVFTLIIAIFLLFRKGLNPFSVFFIIYLYGTSGPLWAMNIYETSLPLINVDRINDSIILFFYSVVGGLIALSIPTIKYNKKIIIKKNQERRLFKTFSILVTGFNVTAIIIIILKINLISSFDKGVMLSDPTFLLVHRTYTLFMFMLVPFSYYIKSIFNIQSRLFFINLTSYFLYMLLTQERDFFLLIISFLIIYNTHIKELSLKRLSAIGVGLVLSFSGLFLIRVFNVDKGQAASLNVYENILNQGSNITITTNIIEHVDVYGYMFGETYIQSFVNLIPSFIYRLGVPLTDWFVLTFFPDSSSGYGFGLEAEAYLNGGYFMSLFFFCVMIYILKNLYKCMQQSSILLGSLFTFSFPFMLYSLRGDSLMLFKGNFIALILICIIIIIALPKIYVRSS